MGKSWIEVFDNWQSFLRFCLALLFVVIGVPLATWLAALALENALLHRSSVELTGGAIIFRGLENDKCVVPIPSNEPWTDTHCKLKKNKKVHIEVSGYINLGIHRLVKAAEEGELRETGWVTADGHPHDQGPQACLYENRTKLNIDPDLPVGAVIGFVQEQGQLGPMDYSNNRPDEHRILKIGKETDLEGLEGELWLGVNDQMIIDGPEFKAAYSQISADCLAKNPDYKFNGATPTKEALEQRWDKYIKQGNMRAFFNDNVGEFLAQITTSD